MTFKAPAGRASRADKARQNHGGHWQVRSGARHRGRAVSRIRNGGKEERIPGNTSGALREDVMSGERTRLACNASPARTFGALSEKELYGYYSSACACSSLLAHTVSLAELWTLCFRNTPVVLDSSPQRSQKSQRNKPTELLCVLRGAVEAAVSAAALGSTRDSRVGFGVSPK
jgi:hypothetical protein